MISHRTRSSAGWHGQRIAVRINLQQLQVAVAQEQQQAPASSPVTSSTVLLHGAGLGTMRACLAAAAAAEHRWLLPDPSLPVAADPVATIRFSLLARKRSGPQAAT